MKNLFLCADCGGSVLMDQAAPTFGLCVRCEADLSKRSTAGAGKRKPLCQKEATSTKGKGRPHEEGPIKTVSQTKAVVKQPKEKPRNRAEILRRERKPYSFSGWQSVYQIKGEMIDEMPI
jgi:hypothetical protein